MLPRLLAWMNDLPIHDHARRYQALVLRNTLVVLLIANLLLTLFAGLPSELASSRVRSIIGCLSTLLLVGGLLLVRSGHLNSAISLTIVIGLLGATEIVATRGLTAHGSITIAYIVPITLAGLLLDRSSLFVVTGLSIILLAGLALLDGLSWVGAETVISFIVGSILLALLLDRYRSGWEHTVDLAGSKELHFQLVLDRTPIAVTMIDPELRVTYWNPAAARLFGWNASEVVGCLLSEVLFSDQEAKQSAHLEQAMNWQSGTTTQLIQHRARDGRGLICEWQHTPLFEFDGSFIGIVGMAQDVTERQRRELAIHELNAALERRVSERTAELDARNRELETFAYSVSHDLKAPLRGLNGYSRLLLEDYATQLEGNGTHYLTMIRRATATMSELIDGLLVYSRVERRTLRISALPLRPLVQMIISEQADTLATTPLTVHLELPELEVWAEEQGLAQVMRNLVENALKFTRSVPAPQVLIGGERQGETCLIWVRDNGIGFAMEYHDRIFELFQRLHRAEEYAGTGIGLAIVRKAVERMGGAVWAESAPSAGATFFLRLPLAPPAAHVNLPHP